MRVTQSELGAISCCYDRQHIDAGNNFFLAIFLSFPVCGKSHNVKGEVLLIFVYGNCQELVLHVKFIIRQFDTAEIPLRQAYEILDCFLYRLWYKTIEPDGKLDTVHPTVYLLGLVRYSVCKQKNAAGRFCNLLGFRLGLLI